MGGVSLKGIRLAHNKNTGALQPVRMEQCARVTLPMAQHTGAPCVPCVQAGERVLAGQLVGRAEEHLCAPIHASISGTVLSADDQAVVIEGDGRMERVQADAPQVNSREEFIQCVRKSGLVGLGGAGFPTSVKLENAAGRADILLVNAAECEPYLTADHREALDNAGDLLEGMEHVCKWLGIQEAIIGIADNKPDAIARLRGQCTQHSAQGLKLRVAVLPSRYPQGAEKLFIYAITGRVVPLGKLPHDAGVLVMNIAGTAFLGRYMRTGLPLISRTVTLDGGAVPRPMNVRVPIGVSLREILAFCGMSDVNPAKIILGGPMMGEAQPDLDSVIKKCDSAVLLFDKKQAKPKPETACIRCGCCLFACPMKLQPLQLEKAVLRRDTQALEALYIGGCMECGCCAYVCPAGRELVERIRQGKTMMEGTQP